MSGVEAFAATWFTTVAAVTVGTVKSIIDDAWSPSDPITTDHQIAVLEATYDRILQIAITIPQIIYTHDTYGGGLGVQTQIVIENTLGDANLYGTSYTEAWPAGVGSDGQPANFWNCDPQTFTYAARVAAGVSGLISFDWRHNLDDDGSDPARIYLPSPQGDVEVQAILSRTTDVP